MDTNVKYSAKFDTLYLRFSKQELLKCSFKYNFDIILKGMNSNYNFVEFFKTVGKSVIISNFSQLKIWDKLKYSA